MSLKQVVIGALLAGAGVIACGAPVESESTGDTQSDLTIHPCYGLACRPCYGDSCKPILPACGDVGDACCAGSTCTTSSSGQHAYCDGNNACDACGGPGQEACGNDCYGSGVLNASGTCQSCSAVAPSFSVTVTGPTSAKLDFKLAKTALAELQITDYVTGAVVNAWDEAFGYSNELYLTLKPATVYVVKFTPTASPTSTGSCPTLEPFLITTPAPCSVGASCSWACQACNDDTCQCAGTITSCANPSVPVCSNANVCANHGGNSGLGCLRQE